jgi:glycosyltransferase involved in cell wall biosynthesis
MAVDVSWGLGVGAMVLGLLSLVVMRLFSQKLQEASHTAIRFRVEKQGKFSLSEEVQSLAVVIPAYNESMNIVDCVTAVLGSSNWSGLQVWVVDDRSTDDTLVLLQQLAADLGDDRLQIVSGSERPENELWMGKNWACAQVMDQVQTDYVLFLDADVRLARGGAEKALTFARRQQTDLLTCWPTIHCGCWGEWLVQPIIVAIIVVMFAFDRVNDPRDETVMAIGPFMLFRRSAYEAIGGHRALAAEIVEDVQLARRIKTQGFKLWYGLGHDLATVQMYRSLPQLWEGWTKNWHLGGNRNTQATLFGALVIAILYPLPWMAGGLAMVVLSHHPVLGSIALGLALGLIFWQIWVRQKVTILANIPGRYWWLAGLGGLIAAAIPVASWIKTETGWGWTWRGRSLKLK